MVSWSCQAGLYGPRYQFFGSHCWPLASGRDFNTYELAMRGHVPSEGRRSGSYGGTSTFKVRYSKYLKTPNIILDTLCTCSRNGVWHTTSIPSRSPSKISDISHWHHNTWRQGRNSLQDNTRHDGHCYNINRCRHPGNSKLNQLDNMRWIFAHNSWFRMGNTLLLTLYKTWNVLRPSHKGPPSSQKIFRGLKILESTGRASVELGRVCFVPSLNELICRIWMANHQDSVLHIEIEGSWRLLVLRPRFWQLIFIYKLLSHDATSVGREESNQTQGETFVVWNNPLNEHHFTHCSLFHGWKNGIQRYDCRDRHFPIIIEKQGWNKPLTSEIVYSGQGQDAARDLAKDHSIRLALGRNLWGYEEFDQCQRRFRDVLIGRRTPPLSIGRNDKRGPVHDPGYEIRQPDTRTCLLFANSETILLPVDDGKPRKEIPNHSHMMNKDIINKKPRLLWNRRQWKWGSALC